MHNAEILIDPGPLRNNLISGFGSSMGHLLPQDPFKFSDMSRTNAAFEFDLTGWVVDKSIPDCDEEGWQYAFSFYQFSRRIKEKHLAKAASKKAGAESDIKLKKLKLCRRRRYVYQFILISTGSLASS